MAAAESSKWKLIGGHIGVDFVNSVSGRIRGDSKTVSDYEIIGDKLSDVNKFIDWAKAYNLISSDESKRISKKLEADKKAGSKLLSRAVDIREALYRIFYAVAADIKPLEGDIDLLNRECNSAENGRRLFYNKGKFFWDFKPELDETEKIINLISLSAAELLTSEKLNRLKECPGDNCGWLFLDTSKNGRRQWCDMKDCGNLAKVRRFRNKS